MPPKKQKKSKSKGKTKGKKRKSPGESKSRSIPVTTVSLSTNNRPRFSGGVDHITVSHREMVGTYGSTGTAWANMESLDLNPGNVDTFPWLAPIAWSWESYSFRSLKFRWTPLCGYAQVGAVEMFVDPDNSDSAPASEAIASSFSGFLISSASEKFVFSCNVAALAQSKKMKYVTPATGIPSSADPTNYNCGTFYIYSVGTGTVTLGTLWIEYTVDLYFPTAGVSEALSLGQIGSALISDDNKAVYATGVTASGYHIETPAVFFTDITAADFVKAGPALSFNATTGEITIPGPGTFGIQISTVFAGTGQGVADNTPAAWTDVFNTLSSGMTFVTEFITDAAETFGSVANIGAVFTVTGSVGVLRLMSAAYPWIITFGGINPGTVSRSYLSLLISFLSPDIGGGPFLKRLALNKDKSREKDYEMVETKMSPTKFSNPPGSKVRTDHPAKLPPKPG